jgi:hypothetical protein
MGKTEAHRAALARELRDSPAIVSHGSALIGAWHDLVDAIDKWADAPAHGSRAHDAEAALRSTAHDVSDQFAALGLGYRLESAILVDRGIAHAAIFVERVERVVFVRTSGEPRRVLDLRRIDQINLVHTLLGMESEDLGDPVVMLDQIDEFVAEHVKPVVAGEPYWLGDAAWHDSYSGRRIATAAAYAIRDEVANKDVTQLFAASVRRHEARHAIDQDRDTPLRTPAPLAALLGAHDEGAFAFRARAELAAYLSQIANDTATPQLALWNVASQAFNHDRWGSPETYVGVVILEGLARHFGHTSKRPVVDQGQLDRSRLVELALPLTYESDDALRAAARALWGELYGEPLVPILD